MTTKGHDMKAYHADNADAAQEVKGVIAWFGYVHVAKVVLLIKYEKLKNKNRPFSHVFTFSSVRSTILFSRNKKPRRGISGTRVPRSGPHVTTDHEY
jgi:hypothetical protein